MKLRYLIYSFLLVFVLIATAFFINPAETLMRKLSALQAARQKEKSVNYFTRYMNAADNDYIICPLPNDSSIQPQLQTGFQWYYQKALQDDAKAQYIIGNAYLAGIGTTLDYDKAMQWYLKSASNGYAPAQAAYGLNLKYDKKLKSLSSKKEIEQKELFWFQKAAAQNDLNGKLLLASYYFNHNFQEGQKLTTELAKDNYPEAQIVLGDIYFYSDDSSTNKQKAIYWYMKALNNKQSGKFVIKHSLLQMYEIYATSGKSQGDATANYWLNQYKEFDKKIHCE